MKSYKSPTNLYVLQLGLLLYAVSGVVIHVAKRYSSTDVIPNAYDT